VANHSPQNKTYLPENEINKPQARISGVEMSMCYPIDPNTCIEVTVHTWPDHALGLLPDSLRITWFWDLTVQIGMMEGSGTHDHCCPNWGVGV
jgi:hypothetical protein